ncbi:uncharacterized protein LOC111461588 isoform X1 [Cucurbita moschata]|uniref:Uncharacterized protein LOC111461588 isoform X1 n=1 Tax=Cucurbita moschata TaxID=3662 RepID=A0A6J1HCJ1_CUCMO|nr:uncharacterized protein LOC111461588 isoform X1 [Cucurbita moschata]
MASQASSDKQATVPREKKVIVNGKSGGKLVGILHEAGSLHIVILCHGYMSSKDDEVVLNLAAAFDREGISSFRFDFSGNGESDGSFQLGNYVGEADELHAIVQYFNEANRSVCAIIGHSKGADVVLVYASKYKDVDIVVNVSGRFDLTTGIEKSLGENYEQGMDKEGFVDVKDSTGKCYRVTAESLVERLNTNMSQLCLQIDKECRVLTVHGTEDAVIPVNDAREFDKIISNHKLHILEGADHNYTAESHQVELATVILNFIKTNLQQDKETDKVNSTDKPLTCKSLSASHLLQTGEVIDHPQDLAHPHDG